MIYSQVQVVLVNLKKNNSSSGATIVSKTTKNSSGAKSVSKSTYNSDYYEKNNFKSADEFADHWDIDFDEDDYDEAWDEAYDYWKD